MNDRYIIEAMAQYFSFRIWDKQAREVVCICLTEDEAKFMCRVLNSASTA